MYLGLDIGTSSVKAMVVNAEGSVVAQSAAPLSVSRPHPLYSEQEPESWWQASVRAVQELPRSARRDVQAVGLTGQMHGATVLDHADRSLRPAILWNDGRSARECGELESIEPEARRITGNIVMPGFTAPKLLWLRKHEPEVFGRIAHVLLPKDYVRLRLTGEKATDMSDASGTAWLNVGERAWSARMLSATGLDRTQVPALAEGHTATGKLRPQAATLLGLPQVIVAAGGGDNAASAAGLGVVQAGEAVLSLGTSGVLFVATDRFRPNPDRAAHAFCHCLPQRWHQMAVILTAASALDWLSSLTGTTIDRLVGVAEARGLRRTTPYFLPYLSGERTPYNDPNCRGVFFGLGSDTESADLALAVLEGVALALADARDALDEPIRTVSVTGGGARFAYWGRILSAALGLSLRYDVAGQNGAAYGAARLARLATTGEAVESVCKPASIMQEVEPDPALVALLRERRRLFRRLYGDLKSAFKEFLS